MPNQLHRGPEVGQRLYAQDAQVFDRGQSFVCILIEQSIEHGAGLCAVAGKYIPLLHVLSPLAPSERGLAIDHAADQVKGVQVLASLLAQLLEQHALLAQLVDNLGLAVRRRPAAQEGV